MQIVISLCVKKADMATAVILGHFPNFQFSPRWILRADLIRDPCRCWQTNVAYVSNVSAVCKIRGNMGIAGIVNLSLLYSCPCMGAISGNSKDMKNMIEVAKW